MGAHRGKGRLVQAQFLCQLRTKIATKASRLIDGREYFLGKTQAFNGFPVPVAGSGIIEHSGSCDRILTLCLPRQEVSQKVGHQEQLICILEGHIILPLSAVELIYRIEIHIGNAGAGKEGLKIHRLPGLPEVLVYAVAVSTGIAQQVTVFIQKAVVHAPGVNTKAIKRSHICLLKSKKTLLQLIEKVGQVPVVDPVHFHEVIFKAVQFPHGQFSVFQLA